MEHPAALTISLSASVKGTPRLWARVRPTRDLPALTRQAWRYLVQNHPHDSICGCSVDAVHKEMDVRFDWVEQIGEEVDIVLDGGPTPGTLPSTVLDLSGEQESRTH